MDKIRFVRSKNEHNPAKISPMTLESKIKYYQNIQMELEKYPVTDLSKRSLTMRFIINKMLATLKRNRIGLWLISSNPDRLNEEMTIGDGGYYSTNKSFDLKSFPIFIEEVLTEEQCYIHRTAAKKCFSEVISHYLIPQSLESIETCAIYLNSQVIGIIFCESTEKHPPLDDLDMMFLGMCANFIRRSLTAEQLNDLETVAQKKIIEIKQANIQLDLAMESAQLALWDFNIVTGVQQVNDQWFSRLGYPKQNSGFSELTGWSELIHPDDKPLVMYKVDELLSGKTQIYEARYRIKQADGKYQWVLDRGRIASYSSDGRPLRAIGVNIDVTPLVRLEDALKDSVHQFKRMIESLPMPVAMLDTGLNLLTYTTQWKIQWGEMHKLVIGEHFFTGTKFEELEQWDERLNRALRGETLEMPEEFVPVNENYAMWIRWIIKPWNMSKDHVGGVIVFAENITEKKEAEIKLYQTSKLSSLGEMAGGIAHEINNPLGIIKGYIETLNKQMERNTWTPDQSRSYLNKMDQTVQRISKIVSGMKRFSRDGSQDKTTDYSLNKIIEETLDICSERIKNSGVEFKVNYLINEHFLRCRPIEVSQVFLNLINNAIHEVTGHDFPWIHIECSDNDATLFVKIIDSGHGIPEKVKQKLFQPFFTTKDVGIGTGLGLSISRGIIESHRGKLYYDDKATNTTFVLEFPKSF